MLRFALAILAVSFAIRSDSRRTTSSVLYAVLPGLAIAGAAVIATLDATGQRFVAKRNESGDYLVQPLPPGEYSVACEQLRRPTDVMRKVLLGYSAEGPHAAEAPVAAAKKQFRRF
jgi:hypothetical protein